MAGEDKLAGVVNPFRKRTGLISTMETSRDSIMHGNGMS